jgi:hypothetical protein
MPSNAQWRCIRKLAHDLWKDEWWPTTCSIFLVCCFDAIFGTHVMKKCIVEPLVIFLMFLLILTLWSQQCVFLSIVPRIKGASGLSIAERAVLVDHVCKWLGWNDRQYWIALFISPLYPRHGQAFDRKLICKTLSDADIDAIVIARALTNFSKNFIIAGLPILVCAIFYNILLLCLAVIVALTVYVISQLELEMSTSEVEIVD